MVVSITTFIRMYNSETRETENNAFWMAVSSYIGYVLGLKLVFFKTNNRDTSVLL